MKYLKEISIKMYIKVLSERIFESSTNVSDSELCFKLLKSTYMLCVYTPSVSDVDLKMDIL